MLNDDDDGGSSGKCKVLQRKATSSHCFSARLRLFPSILATSNMGHSKVVGHSDPCVWTQVNS